MPRTGLMPRISLALLAAATFILTNIGAQAQQGYPNQVVRIVVPFSAGSATDLLARAVADKLSEKWKQQVIVENRPGIAGTTTVAKSTADGYTLMLTSNGHTVAGVLNKGLQQHVDDRVVSGGSINIEMRAHARSEPRLLEAQIR